MRILPFAALVWLVALPACAAGPIEPFARLAPLQGTWLARPDGGGKPVEIRYDYASKNTVLTERFGTELSVFSRDGARVVLTHYCNAGNTPRFVLRDAADDTTLAFDFLDIANLKRPGAAHVDAVTYRFLAPDRIDATWRWTEDGKPNAEHYVMTREAGTLR
jgi:hypothetical protein